MGKRVLNIILISVLVLILFIISGCSNPSITGHVTYQDKTTVDISEIEQLASEISDDLTTEVKIQKLNDLFDKINIAINHLEIYEEFLQDKRGKFYPGLDIEEELMNVNDQIYYLENLENDLKNDMRTLGLKSSIEVTNIEYEPIVLSSVSEYYSMFGLYNLKFNIKNNDDFPTIVNIKFSLGGVVDDIKKSINLDSQESKTFTFNFNKLDKNIISQTSSNLHYEIYTGNDVVYENSLPVTIYPSNGLMLNVNSNDENYDLSELLAYWITPKAQLVNDFIIFAKDYTNFDTSSSCEDCEEKDYRQQSFSKVAAVFNTLKKINMNVKDFDLKELSEENKFIKLQTPSETLSFSSGSLLEIGLLYVSILERLNLNTYLVYSQDDVLVCWDISANQDFGTECVDLSILDQNFNYATRARSLGADKFLIDDRENKFKIISVEDARANEIESIN